MQFHSQSRADLATRILFFTGIALTIAGVMNLREHKALGAALLIVGLIVAAAGPGFVSGPATGSGPADGQKSGDRIELP